MVKLKKTFQTNLKRVRERVEEYKERKDSYSDYGPGGDITWYDWKENNNLRLLPVWSEDMAKEGIIAKVVHTHYNLPPEGSGHRCLRKTYSRQCYICTAFSRVWQQDKEYSFRWMVRAYTNCIDRDNEDKGVQVIGLPMSVYRWIEQIMLEEEVGDITNVEFGSDIKVRKDKIGNSPRDIKYTTSLWEKNTPLHSSTEQMNEWIEQIHDIDGIFREPNRKSFQENLKAANQFLRDCRLTEIDPDRLKESDLYKLEETFPRDSGTSTGNGPSRPNTRRSSSRKDEEEIMRESAEEDGGNPDCFGHFDKDSDQCLVCAVGSNCTQATADSDDIPF